MIQIWWIFSQNTQHFLSCTYKLCMINECGVICCLLPFGMVASYATCYVCSYWRAGGLLRRMQSRQGYLGYFREPHWISIGSLKISMITWQVRECFGERWLTLEMTGIGMSGLDWDMTYVHVYYVDGLLHQKHNSGAYAHLLCNNLFVLLQFESCFLVIQMFSIISQNNLRIKDFLHCTYKGDMIYECGTICCHLPHGMVVCCKINLTPVQLCLWGMEGSWGETV